MVIYIIALILHIIWCANIVVLLLTLRFVVVNFGKDMNLLRLIQCNDILPLGYLTIQYANGISSRCLLCQGRRLFLKRGILLGQRLQRGRHQQGQNQKTSPKHISYNDVLARLFCGRAVFLRHVPPSIVKKT